MANVGILGGTFNPPHLGHVLLAQEALVAFSLDRVLVLPAGTPPHKEIEDDPGAGHRVAMCKLAVGGDERLEVSLLESQRDGPSYTVDTLRIIAERGPQDELTLILGGDMAHSLPSWREPETILELASVVVAQREGVGREEASERLEELAGASEHVRFFDMPRVDVSSSMVRRRVREGRPITYLVASGVERYIAEHRLYGAPA